MGLGGERKTAARRPTRKLDLSEKGVERARLQSLLQRPDEIGVAARLDHDDPVRIEPHGGKTLAAGASELAAPRPAERP